MWVVKKINNNVAVCRDNNGRELVAFSKGIGFPTMPYELTDLRKIERTFYNIGVQYLSLLNEIPYEIIQFTADELQIILDELPCETYSSLVFTLSDQGVGCWVTVSAPILHMVPRSYHHHCLRSP